MIFKCFSETVDYIGSLNLNVNAFIEQNEQQGYCVVKQETIMQQYYSGNKDENRNSDLVVLVSVWMEKAATNLSRDSYQKQRVMNNTLSSLSRERKFAHLSN